MLKRLDRYVFNSLKVAITGMTWYALFAIPYERYLKRPSRQKSLLECWFGVAGIL